jgi:glycosyltransferase involved in cell wall biosynthesis
MNIILFTDTFQQINGVSSIYKSLVKWTAHNNPFKLYVVSTSQKTHTIQLPNVTIIYVRPSVVLAPPFYRELRTGLFPLKTIDRLISKSMHVVHVATQGPVGALGGSFARRHGLPLLGYYHTDFRRYCSIYGERWLPFGHLGGLIGSFFANFMNRLVYGSSSLLLVQSKAYVNEVRKFARCPIEVIRSGVDIDFFSPPDPIDARGGRLRDEYLGKCRHLAIYVGRIALEKNLSSFLNIYKELENHGVRLVLVGDGPFRKAIENSSRIPVTGYLLGSRLLDAYRSADLLAFPSQTDTYGMVVLEAMACGLPVVCSNVGGQVETVQASNAGVLCNTREPNEIIDACLRIVKYKSDWLYYAKKAISYAKSYSLDQCFLNLMKHYQTLSQR